MGKPPTIRTMILSTAFVVLAIIVGALRGTLLVQLDEPAWWGTLVIVVGGLSESWYRAIYCQPVNDAAQNPGGRSEST
jgi:hypothetical protein